MSYMRLSDYMIIAIRLLFFLLLDDRNIGYRPGELEKVSDYWI
jgi:hypothetical protein